MKRCRSVPVVFAGVLLALAACRAEHAPLVGHLATRLEPEPIVTWPWDEGSADAPQGGYRIVPADDADCVWIEHELGRSDWEPYLLPGGFAAERPFVPNALPRTGGRGMRLLVDGRELDFVDAELVQRGAWEVRSGVFTSFGDRIGLLIAPGEPPPERAVLRCYLRRGTVSEGRVRAELGGTTGDGLVLLPDWAETVHVETTDPRQLWFESVVYGPAGGGEVTLRVSFRGELLAELRQAPASPESIRTRSVVLPSGAGALTFEVSGRGGVCALIAPRLVTPAPGRGPDVLVFLADTFRADLMTVGGAGSGRVPGGVAPVLDGFTAGARAFTNALAPASWTLPSHASLFTGLYPLQHRVGLEADHLVSQARTLAEDLRDAGWRTVAVTDGGYASASRGLGQGFEAYCELPGDLELTLARTRDLCAVNDGRPVFLFVQSYAVHGPYRPDAASLEHLYGEGVPTADYGATASRAAQLWDTLETELGGEDDDAWARRRVELGLQAFAEAPEPDSRLEEFARVQDELLALYAGGAHRFDRWFAGFLEATAQMGFDDEDLVVFTSDHGEAFGERGARAHGDSVWDVELRVPLVLRGPGIEPGVDARPASLVDLPATIHAFLGLRGDVPGPGVDLLGERGERELFASSSQERGVRSDARIAWPSKLVRRVRVGTAGSRALRDAYALDLESDPREQELGLIELEGAAVADLARFEFGLEPLLEVPDAFPVDPAEEARLRALGYLDDE